MAKLTEKTRIDAVRAIRHCSRMMRRIFEREWPWKPGQKPTVKRQWLVAIDTMDIHANRLAMDHRALAESDPTSRRAEAVHLLERAKALLDKGNSTDINDGLACELLAEKIGRGL